MYGIQQTVAPATEALTLAEVKAWCRVDFDDDDALLASLIASARRLVEQTLGRQLVTATWALSVDYFPGYGGWRWLYPQLFADLSTIKLPRAPLVSVTGITYVDMAGVTQTLAASVYDVDTAQDPGRVTLAQYQIWPLTRLGPSVVKITFTAGYGTAANVPDELKVAMKLAIANVYENRGDDAEAKLPMAIDTYLSANWNGEYS